MPPGRRPRACVFNNKRERQQAGNPRISRNTRATIKLAAVNMNGLRATSLSQASHKWHEIHSIMRAKQLGILVVTETHMSTIQSQEIQNSFMNKRLKLFNYEYPENPAAK